MKMQIKDYFIGTIDAITLDEWSRKINKNDALKNVSKIIHLRLIDLIFQRIKRIENLQIESLN